MIRTNICIGKYTNIFEYPNIRHALSWPIFPQESLLMMVMMMMMEEDEEGFAYERISEYIHIKNDTN